jgi:hypothetical protein
MATTAISAVLTGPPALSRFDSVESVFRDLDVQSPSSLGDDSTPDTELSLSSEPPLELDAKKASVFTDAKANARRKAASLSLEEQVGSPFKMMSGRMVLTRHRFLYLELQIIGGQLAYRKKEYLRSKHLMGRTVLVVLSSRLGHE